MSGLAARTETPPERRTGPRPGDSGPRTSRPASSGGYRRSRSRILILTVALFAEAALLGVLFLGYQMGRHFADGRVGDANANALWLWDFERLLRLPDEHAIQEWALAWDPLARLANLYYIGGHFPVMCALLVCVFLWFPRHYGRLRAELVIATALGLVLHTLTPMTPPRLLPGLDMADTMTLVGPSAYSAPGSGDGIANQYAAMPSLHVGWSLLVALVVIRVVRGRWRWLALAHPLLTTVVVVVTANHYWLDALVGSALVGVAVLVARALPSLLPSRLVRFLFGTPGRSLERSRVEASA